MSAIPDSTRLLRYAVHQLAISGFPLEEHLIINPDPNWPDQSTEWAAIEDGYFLLSHDQVIRILDAWRDAQTTDPASDVIREFTYSEPDELFATALSMDGEINIEIWRRDGDGYHMEDMPFDFEVELLDSPDPRQPLDDPRPPAWDLYSEICAVIDRVKLDERTQDTDVYASAIEALIERSKR